MVRTPADTPLIYLARQTFWDYSLLANEGAARYQRENLPTPERRAEFQQWMAKHSAMSMDELMPLVDAARRKAEELWARRVATKEQTRFFNQPEAQAEFSYWGKMAHWTIDEAIALSLGKSPTLVKLEQVKQHAFKDIDGFPPSPFAVEYLKRMELARRSIPWKELFDPALPSLFLRWAQKMDLTLPAQLVAVVEARSPIRDWKDLYDKKVEEVAQLSATIEKATATLRVGNERIARLTQERDEAAAEAVSLGVLVDELRAEVKAKSGSWPWGSYETAALAHMAEAVTKWWMNADPADNTTAPTNEQVSQWLQARGVSKRTADAMATILRADDLPTGPRA